MSSFSADAPILSASDAERLVEALQPMGIRAVGTEAWYLQHVALQRLNLQTHWCAREQSDDFVLEALLTHDKMASVWAACSLAPRLPCYSGPALAAMGACLCPAPHPRAARHRAC